MQQKFFLLLFQCTFFCNLFNFPFSTALIGENVRYAFEEEFPYVVSLSFVRASGEEYYHVCTGSLVSVRDVLTADHCVNGESVEKMRIIVGKTNLIYGRHVLVESYKTYTQWANEVNLTILYKHNDVAMIRLKENVTDIELGVLSDRRNHRFVACDVSISGWGKKDDDTVTLILQTADVIVLDLIECQAKIRATGSETQIQSIYFCTHANPYVFVHLGDSGGPVVYQRTIIGINLASCPYPDRAYHPKKVNIHAGVYHYKVFIHEFIVH